MSYHDHWYATDPRDYEPEEPEVEDDEAGETQEIAVKVERRMAGRELAGRYYVGSFGG